MRTSTLSQSARWSCAHYTIVDLIEQGFQLSESSNTPVILEVRVRTCHMHGSFIAKDNVKPAFTLKDALNNPKRDLGRIVLPPDRLRARAGDDQGRMPAAVDFVQKNKLKEWMGPLEGKVGILMQGGMSSAPCNISASPMPSTTRSFCST